ncbi:response regulator transcription factor [Streptomyces sp. S.PB5]|uniref:response regulator transcription factor n=1 Tax=Streptomyces sp. S.PB5 TaxID=3020844 RepID=UPI0025B10B3A|nr:response regulator transcription factor [Streptomyces sp. S.PB5]MDN3022234.1 response regulator transcription factor [Streptomyces sp. S.PB5]
MLIRILLAEDVGMVRGALVALLNLEPDFDVVAEVAAGDAVVGAALAARPDVAVIDIHLPKLDGISAAAELREALPECRTVIITSLGKPGTLRRALTQKVTGFVLKDAPAGRLAEAVRQVAAGERVFDNELALAALDTGDSPLTDRETEILRRASRGAEATEIAAGLHLSVGTVRNYLTSAVTKLGARNRLDAVRIAQDAGWLM